MTNHLRSVALLAILLTVGIATFLIAYARPAPTPPQPISESIASPMYSYLIDVAGWYEITPNERAVASAIDFSIGHLNALPPVLASWSGEPIGLGSEVNEWFENPDVALSSLYRDARGNPNGTVSQIWFSVFGSKSRKSYFLFEHTPATSYPAAGWNLVDQSLTPVPLGSNSIYVQKVLLTKDGERRIALYWYLWSDFNRDPEQGVLTMRLHIPVVTTDEDAIAAGADFLRALFPQVINWHRF